MTLAVQRRTCEMRKEGLLSTATCKIAAFMQAGLVLEVFYRVFSRQDPRTKNLSKS